MSLNWCEYGIVMYVFYTEYYNPPLSWLYVEIASELSKIENIDHFCYTWYENTAVSAKLFPHHMSTVS